MSVRNAVRVAIASAAAVAALTAAAPTASAIETPFDFVDFLNGFDGAMGGFQSVDFGLIKFDNMVDLGNYSGS